MNNKIAAIIPTFKTEKTALRVANNLLDFVDIVICVDDKCPLNTGKIIEKGRKDDKRIIVLYHDENKGVGGATKTGIKYALDLNYEIIIKIDSDGQMSPNDIPRLIEPLKSGQCGLSKGNRFTDNELLINMPIIRLLGNIFLSFITKLSTGYWELFDPTNGFIAMNNKTAKLIKLDKVDDRFFFESDILFRCSLSDVVIFDIPIEANYRNEVSSLNPIKQVFPFLIKHTKCTFKRILYHYFIRDFNPGSISLILGIFSGIIGIYIGISRFVITIMTGETTPFGIQVLFLTCILISNQLLISFIFYDSTQRPLLRRLKKLL